MPSNPKPNPAAHQVATQTPKTRREHSPGRYRTAVAPVDGPPGGRPFGFDDESGGFDDGEFSGSSIEGGHHARS